MNKNFLKKWPGSPTVCGQYAMPWEPLGRNCHLAGDRSLFFFSCWESVTALSWDQPMPTLSQDQFPVSCDQIMLYLSVCSVVSL